MEARKPKSKLLFALNIGVTVNGIAYIFCPFAIFKDWRDTLCLYWEVPGTLS